MKFIDDFEVEIDLDFSGDRPQYVATSYLIHGVAEYGDYAYEAVQNLWMSAVITEEILGVDLF